MNAILVKGDATGPTLYYGAGAGARADGQRGDRRSGGRDAHAHGGPGASRAVTLAFQPDQLTNVPVLPIGEVVTSYTCACASRTDPAWLADITRILADRDISIDAMIQKEPSEGEEQTDIILLTHRVVEKNVVDAIAKIEALPTVRGTIVRIRLEELN
jgi:homoserine dehydrogenase